MLFSAITGYTRKAYTAFYGLVMYQTFACVANINGIWFLYSTNFTSKILKPVLFSEGNSQLYISILVQVSSLYYLYKYIEQCGELFRFKDSY